MGGKEREMSKCGEGKDEGMRALYCFGREKDGDNRKGEKGGEKGKRFARPVSKCFLRGEIIVKHKMFAKIYASCKLARNVFLALLA